MLFEDVLKLANAKLDQQMITQAEFDHIRSTMCKSKLMLEIQPLDKNTEDRSTSHSKPVGHQSSHDADESVAASAASQVPKATRATHSDGMDSKHVDSSSEDLEVSDSSSEDLEDEREVRLPTYLQHPCYSSRIAMLLSCMPIPLCSLFRAQQESMSCLVEFCAALGRGETLVRDDKVDKIWST